MYYYIFFIKFIVCGRILFVGLKTKPFKYNYIIWAPWVDNVTICYLFVMHIKKYTKIPHFIISEKVLVLSSEWPRSLSIKSWGLPKISQHLWWQTDNSCHRHKQCQTKVAIDAHKDIQQLPRTQTTTDNSCHRHKQQQTTVVTYTNNETQQLPWARTKTDNCCPRHKQRQATVATDTNNDIQRFPQTLTKT